MTYGTIIPNLKIHGKEANYPVLNERDAMAAAGIMLVIGVAVFTYTFFVRDYTYLYITVLLFFIEFGKG